MAAPLWQPHLIGTRVELRPLERGDFDRLFAVAADPLLWEQHPASDRYQEPVFREFFDGAMASGGALLALDARTGEVIGSSRFANHDLVASRVEIGWTFLARSRWGGIFNPEMKRLMLDYAFQHVKRVGFVVGASNMRSRTALERIGAVLTGTVEDRLMKGASVPHVVYEIGR